MYAFDFRRQSLTLNKTPWVTIEYSKSIVQKHVFYNSRKSKDLSW